MPLAQAGGISGAAVAFLGEEKVLRPRFKAPGKSESVVQGWWSRASRVWEDAVEMAARLGLGGSTTATSLYRPDRIAKYRKLKEIRRFAGGRQSVRVVLLEGGEVVAKHLNPQSRMQCHSYEREVENLVRLQSCPYVPKLLAADPKRLVIYLSYCGESPSEQQYDDTLKADVRAKVDELERRYRLRRTFYSHTDIPRPSNVTLKDGQAFIIDLGPPWHLIDESETKAESTRAPTTLAQDKLSSASPLQHPPSVQRGPAASPSAQNSPASAPSMQKSAASSPSMQKGPAASQRGPAGFRPPGGRPRSAEASALRQAFRAAPRFRQNAASNLSPVPEAARRKPKLVPTF